MIALNIRLSKGNIDIHKQVYSLYENDGKVVVVSNSLGESHRILRMKNAIIGFQRLFNNGEKKCLMSHRDISAHTKVF